MSKSPRDMSKTELREAARTADAAFAIHLDRVYLADERFRLVLDWILAVEDEQIRRKKGR